MSKYPITMTVKVSAELAAAVAERAEWEHVTPGTYARRAMAAAVEDQVPVRLVLEQLLALKKVVETLATQEWMNAPADVYTRNYQLLLKKANGIAKSEVDVKMEEMRAEKAAAAERTAG